MGSAASSTAQQGYSVSLSGDGTTLAVGGPADNSNTGAVWIFTRSGGVWTQQGSKLVGTGGTPPSQQGYSVSLSADATTLAVGGPDDNGTVGAVWPFTQSAGVWSQQGSALVGALAVGNARQGSSVALSVNGTTLVIGGPADNGNAGAVWPFTQVAGVWSQQGSKLIGSDATGNANQGVSVSISGDGNTVSVGGPTDTSNAGAVWIFTRSGGSWAQQGAKLVGTGASGATVLQGFSVALSADGNTLAEGGSNDGGGLGATWIFV